MMRFSKTVVVILVILIFITALWAWKGELLPGGLPRFLPQKETAEETESLTVSEESVNSTESPTEETVPAALQEESGTEQEGQGTPSVSQETGYAYGLLAEEEQQLYREMLQAITGFGRDAELSTLNPDLLEPVFNSIMADHPEIFYVDGYTYTKHTLGEEIHKITFSGQYTLTQEQVREREEGIERYSRQALEGIHTGMDDYQKIKYIYDYMIEHTDYRLDAPENQTICSVFLYGESVCQGYAKAFQFLCGRLGIPAVLVTGRVKNGEPHAWDMVLADGEWYYVDPTWGDAYYLMGDDDPAWQGKTRPSVNYDYLLVTTQQLLQTHKIDNAFPLPECTSMKDNYYVRENAYFESVDETKLSNLFARGYEEDKGIVTLKCADQTVYQDMKKTLLDDQKIFDYLRGDNASAAYVDTQEQFTLSFWLE